MEPISGTSVWQNAAIENLPAELRHAILHALDYKSLRAMAQASPVFHQQYLQGRRLLLSGCLQRTLGTATVDACAVYRSNPECFTDERTRESVTQFLEPYRNRLSLTTYSISDEGLADKEVEALFAFHLTVIEPLVQSFVNWALGNFARETEAPPPPQPLSRTEEARIVRAMYRFQLCCNLFHDRRHQWISVQLDALDMLELVFSLFEPWEVEQVVCVYAFVQDRFDRIFSAIHGDVSREHPRFADVPRGSTPIDSFDFDNDYERTTWLGGTVLSGLGRLHSVLFKMRDHEHLVSTMQKTITGGELFDDALWDVSQSTLRREQPSERDLKEEAREPLPFVGDVVPDIQGSSCPPLAWTLVWKGTYSNRYGDYLGDKMRRWGYVMWDAARLEVGKGEALIWTQWGAETDPREMP
ncbi:hypothetical protein C8A05DRAFT_46603 [Staphylotrichum tortipilum]|uniref:F-box domain-containing protein n=1 Tax=Staphylotrichum tortipilum TaxID=2831512 RepID=A0AAN6RQJ2_9PEZI|nr:hypothetical protein C8A05DRAFT_46603 [Staphylotrichum longicolle]